MPEEKVTPTPEAIDDPQRTDAGSSQRAGARLEPGTRVEVRSTLEHRWARGFEVSQADEGGYRIRRLTDGAELPGVIATSDVRKERKRGNWWY